MKTIEVYLFDELPEDVQKKVHKNAGWRPSPWEYENWVSWRCFEKDVFPDLIETYDSEYRHVYCKDSNKTKMKGKRLVKYLYKRLGELPELPTGYVFDYACYGFAREHLEDIVRYNMDAYDYINHIFGHFCDMVQEDEDYFNSFEGYKDEAEANDWYYTITGEQVNV